MGVRIGGLGSGTRRWRGGEWGEGEGGGLTFPELTGDLDFLAFVPVVVVFWFDISPGGRFRGSGGCEIGEGGSEGKGGDGLVKEMHCELRDVAMDRVWLEKGEVWEVCECWLA